MTRARNSRTCTPCTASFCIPSSVESGGCRHFPQSWQVLAKKRSAVNQCRPGAANLWFSCPSPSPSHGRRVLIFFPCFRLDNRLGMVLKSEHFINLLHHRKYSKWPNFRKCLCLILVAEKLVLLRHVCLRNYTNSVCLVEVAYHHNCGCGRPSPAPG